MATYVYTGAGSTEEITEMGEKVSLVYPDPGELGDPPANEIISYWAEMQWQCSDTAEQFWGGFANLPFHCQMSRLISSSQRPGELYGPSRSSDPNRIKGHGGLQRNIAGYLNSPSDLIMAFAMSASDKPAGKGGGLDEEGADCPYPDGSGGSVPGKIGKDGECGLHLPNVTVDVSTGEIPGFVAAGDDKVIGLPDDLKKRINERAGTGTECGKHLERLFNTLKTQTGQKLKNHRKSEDRSYIEDLYLRVANKINATTDIPPFTADTGGSEFFLGGAKINFGLVTEEGAKARGITREQVYNQYITVLLHELIHRSKKNGQWTDVQVLDAVISMMKQDGKEQIPDRTGDAKLASSRVNSFFRTYCPNP